MGLGNMILEDAGGGFPSDFANREGVNLRQTEEGGRYRLVEGDCADDFTCPKCAESACVGCGHLVVIRSGFVYGHGYIATVECYRCAFKSASDRLKTLIAGLLDADPATLESGRG